MRPIQKVFWNLALATVCASVGWASGCGDTTLAVTDGYPTDDDIEAFGSQGGTSGGELPFGDGDTPGQPGMGETGVSDGAGASIEVETPTPGELITDEAVTVSGSASEVDAVTVNGQRVPVEAGRFEAQIPLTSEGPQPLTIQGGELPPLQIPVVVDWTPPIIQISSPSRGAFLVAGQDSAIQVQGQAVDIGAGVREVLVNGAPVSVGADGSFSVAVTPQLGLNTVEVIATDEANRRDETFRSAMFGSYAPWGQPAYDAISGRILAAAIDVIEQAVSNGLASGVADDLINQNAPNNGDDFRIRYVRYGRIELELTPQQGYFDTVIRLYNLEIGVEVEQRLLFFDVTVDGEVSSNPAELRTKLYLTLNQQGGLEAELRDNQVALRDFDLDLEGLLDLFGELFEGLVREFAEDALLDVLNELVLGELLAPDALNQTIDLFGKQADLRIMLTQFTIQPAGIVFAADSDVSVEADPSIPQAPGVYTTAGAVPDNAGQTQHMRISVADDFINTLLFNVWRSGGLNLDVADAVGGDSGDMGDGGGGGGLDGLELNAGTFALLAGDELLEHASPDTPVGIQINALMPPLASIRPPEQGVLNVGIGDMIMTFTLEPEGQDPIPWAQLAVNLDMNIRLTNAEGEFDLGFTVGSRAELLEEPLFDLDDNTLETVVEGLMAALPDLALGGEEGGDLLGDLFGGGEEGGIPLDGLDVRNLNIVPDGEGKDFMSIYLDLAMGQ